MLELEPTVLTVEHGRHTFQRLQNRMGLARAATLQLHWSRAVPGATMTPTSTAYTIFMLELDLDGALIGGLPLQGLHLGKRAGA